MNPLSAFTYYRRHKRQTLPLMAVIALVTLGVYTMVSVTDSLVEYTLYRLHYLTRLSHVSAEGKLDPEIMALIRAHPDVARVIPQNGMDIGVPWVGIPILFPALGVRESDLPVVMAACDLRLKEGRLIEPRAAEIVLSEELARALDLRIGDPIGREIDERYYGAFVTELTVVGILETGPSTKFGTGPSDAEPNVRAAFVSYEYIEGHELYGPRPPSLLVIPHQGHKATVDDFLETLVANQGGSPHIHLKTYESETEFLTRTRLGGYGFYGFVDCLVAGTGALVIAAINQISITRRLPELGLLHALGYRKPRQIRRLVLEVAAIAGSGWSAGLALSLLLSAWLNNSFYAPKGWALNPTGLAPFLFTVPIPLAVIVFTGLGINRTLNRLDAVAIIERGQLSAEADRRQLAIKRSSSRPLSFITFYARHRRRGLMLFIAIVLMVLGVAFPAFFTATYNDGNVPFIFSYLRHASIVSPAQMYGTVDPEVVAQIRAHPVTAHVVPAKPLSLVVNASAAIFGQIGMPIYAVHEDDLRILMDVYGMHLGDGRLPHARSNEIVLSSAVALNRGVRVGDRVGQPVYEGDNMPTEMVVVGILEPDRHPSPSEPAKRPYSYASYAPQWIGFASYEYVEGHDRYAAVSTHFLVTPVAGREAELEAWLEENVDSPQVTVETFDKNVQFARDVERDMFLFFAAVETIVTVAAAVALAVLQYIFFAQRREEFGILHAVGRSRPWLVFRTVKETGSVVGIAWMIGAAVCIVGLIGAQAVVYAPRGLRLDFFNMVPWLFTLPIPLAVIVGGAGTIAWTLSKLDPVSIIERR